MPTELSKPWKSFLAEIDSGLEEAVYLHCLGGFVLTTVYDLPRTTADVDVVAIASVSSSAQLLGLAGKALSSTIDMVFTWTLSLLLRYQKITSQG
jgi:hypothetical protein